MLQSVKNIKHRNLVCSRNPIHSTPKRPLQRTLKTYTTTTPPSLQKRQQLPHIVTAMTSADQTQTSSPHPKKTSVLFVCLGNICRSPTAEAVFQSVIDKQGISSNFIVDSCGTGGGSQNWYTANGFSFHQGDPSDSRMTHAASNRGIKLTSTSRPLQPSDLTSFDYIIGMDASNIRAIHTAAEHWKGNNGNTIPPDYQYQAKLSTMTDYLQSSGKFVGKYKEVPDPYYGGAQGFEIVLDLLEDACIGLLEEIKENSK